MDAGDLFEFAARTDAGLVRTQNEDCIAVDPRCGFAIVADGMGGYNAGEVASSIAVTSMGKVLERGLGSPGAANSGACRTGSIRELLVDAVQCANRDILEAAASQSHCHGMGTTLVAAVVRHDTLTIAHVGDSRAYRFRHGELLQLTRDHSPLQQQVDAGLITEEAARVSVDRNLISRAVGVDAALEVEVHDYPIEAGDLYLLCSDGLSDMLAAAEIAEIVAHSYSDLNKACGDLVRKANESGGHDNLSVVLLQTSAEAIRPYSLLGRVRRWLG